MFFAGAATDGSVRPCIYARESAGRRGPAPPQRRRAARAAEGTEEVIVEFNET